LVYRVQDIAEWERLIDQTFLVSRPDDFDEIRLGVFP
jgi:hypothetical protein